VSTQGAAQRVAHNTVWNLLGQVLPMLVGFVTIPVLIRYLGIDRFGFITLVWMLIGYAGVFDFGISRAMTRVIAECVAQGDLSSARRISKVGLNYMLLFGCVIGVLLALASPVIVERWLGLPEVLKHEGFNALLLLCTSIPVVMLTTGYTGCIQAWERFAALNKVRIVLGFATYLAPMLVAFFSQRLEAVVGVVVLIRIAANAAHAWVCKRECDVVFRPAMPDRATTRTLFSLGGWIAISNFVSPLLSYLDRLIIGGLLPVRMIAYYATPYDLLGKLMMLPYALTTALFPAAAGLASDPQRALQMYATSLRVMFVAMFPPILFVVAFARPGLHMWLGAEFADHAALSMQILGIGLLFNMLAQVPATMIQAFGQPRWMAIMHICELPLFLVVLWLLTREFGIVGTATAAALRFFVDACIVFGLAGFKLFARRVALGEVLTAAVPAILLLVCALEAQTLLASVLVFVVGLGFFYWLAWFRIFDAADRMRVASMLRGLRPTAG
jgi:O-antigen/teichoic acid export membrane protein